MADTVAEVKAADDAQIGRIVSVRWGGKRAKLLKALGEHGNMRRACRETCIAVMTAYNWCDADPAFDAAVEVARETGLRGFYDAAVDYTYRAIEAEEATITTEGVRVALKAMASIRPKLWAETTKHELSGPDGKPISISRAEDLSDDDLAHIATGSGARATATA